MTAIDVFFAAAQTGEAICGAAEALTPYATILAALYLGHRTLRRIRQRTATRDQRRMARTPEPDFNETDQAIDDLWTCRHIAAQETVERNTGTLNPRRKEQP
ncbi:hypothetical protein [Streptomyces sp. CBMA152]|uniref:hypothetical protein n=1 Tax=Streptomyces sp. CBMA152 TaxID=1896312 RepID=UPI0016602B5E|nr:hypothetical protein [Streptomyces sp. CBMA152]MBD0743513.1 hypothetical protein [Streptomyces sp. CBMA152]